MSTIKTNRIENVSGTVGIDTPLLGNLETLTNRNFLINGDFQIWQRGTSFTTSGEFIADRWILTQNGETSALSRNTTSTSSEWNGKFLLNFYATAGEAANTSRVIYQRIENVNLFKDGKFTVSLVSNAVDGQDIYAALTQRDGTILWQSGKIKMIKEGTNDIARYTLTFDVPDISTRKTIDESWMAISIYPQYTDGAFVAISEIQFEKGENATPFDTRPLKEELALCQRYLYSWKTGHSYGGFVDGYVYSETEGRALVYYPVELRGEPTLTVSGTFNCSTPSTSYSVSSTTLIRGNNQGSTISFAITSGAVDEPFTYRANGDGTASIYFDAEL